MKKANTETTNSTRDNILDIIYTDLRIEMADKRIGIKALAELCGFDYSVLYTKLCRPNNKVYLDVGDCVDIKNALGSYRRLEELFCRKDV